MQRRVMFLHVGIRFEAKRIGRQPTANAIPHKEQLP